MEEILHKRETRINNALHQIGETQSQKQIQVPTKRENHPKSLAFTYLIQMELNICDAEHGIQKLYFM